MHVACRARGAGSVVIIFPSEGERLSEDPAPLAHTSAPLAKRKMPFDNLLIPESVE